MSKESKVRLYEKIRKTRDREPEVSIRELSRRFGVHRRDVRAALVSAVPTARKSPQRRAPKLGRFKPVIDGWLEADRSAPRKQRHTARRVWQRLIEEYDADVGESTVRRYVAEVRGRLEVPLVEVKVPQHHPLGAEAEVDFGSIHVYLAGVLTEVSMFVMRPRLPWSAHTTEYSAPTPCRDRWSRGSCPDPVDGERRRKSASQ